ncbi:MAG: PVC-type heme-binding CxxCH protein, partial [Actinomycetota bacterium]
SPIANERHQDRNFPDPSENNRNIAAYTDAMREVAEANGVPFVDLFTPSRALFEESAERNESLTANGLYLTEEGYSRLAPVVFQSLFGTEAPSGDLEKLRVAVNEKNWEWHQRYRIIDGYNIYGGRSALAYRPGETGFISDRTPPEPFVSNYRVMQQEMAQRDVITANRDRRVWAVAQGGDLDVDDSNLPEVDEVVTNKPGPNPDGSHVFLSGEEAIEEMTVHSGMKVNLFADEAQFPELINPVQMAWDTKGRLWVAVWPEYPGQRPTSTRGDSLLIFEDTNRDGTADKMTVFADDLNAPTGFQFYKDGVLLMQAPDLWFLRDTTGDGKADWKERILMGMDSADSHHTTNAMAYDPGGATYLSDGVFHRTQVETFRGPVRNNDGGIYRFEPNTGRFELYISYGFANPHGRVFDRWGNDLITDATGNNTYYGPAISGRLDREKGKHSGIRQFWNRPSRPVSGTGILSSRHFPEEFQGNFLNLNAISFQGIFRVNVTEEGSGLHGETMEHLLYSSDANFIPTDVGIGPDGAIYFTDWQNPIVGHMQHHLRDPSRDDSHGRIYRVTYEDRPLLEQPQIDGAPIPALLDLLKEPEDHVRILAKIELGNHDSDEVIAALADWVEDLDSSHPDYEHHRMEALWVHDWQNVVNAGLLHRMLESPDARARAAAGRVLCYWRDSIPDSLELFMALAEDEHPRVRLEGVRGASFYRSAEAAEVALAVLKRPTDYYIEYTLNETLRQLEPYWRQAISEGVALSADNPAGIDYLIGRVTTEELENLPRTQGVLRAILTRPEASHTSRTQALQSLALESGTSQLSELLSALDNVEDGDSATATGLARLLPMMPASELSEARDAVMELALNGNSSGVRQPAWAAVVMADGSFDAAWEKADSPEVLTDIVAAIPQILNPQLRNQAYSRVHALLDDLPVEMQRPADDDPTGYGRYVRIELPRTGALTLAEVQVFSNGVNIAPGGSARQSSTSNGGAASRAIDGGTSGSWGSGTQTHTNEGEDNPWWELDLGGENSIESIAVWNRTDGNLGQRLDGFTLTVLDGNRTEVFKQTDIPAPSPNTSLEVNATDPAIALRRAAIRALVSMHNNREGTFQSLVDLIVEGKEPVAAAQGIRTLPRTAWSEEEAGKAATALVAWAKDVPASERTRRDYVETIQIASDLAAALPSSEASALNADLRGLRVDVFVVRAVREQMRFDTTRIVVEAGKPFEIIFENPDFMPHNLIIVEPGTRSTIGPIADRMMPDEFDSQGRSYVPDSPSVIAATKMLEAGEAETLSVTAPTEEGVYEFVCTFPGHWTVMWGQLIVTDDVDAYLENNPEADLTTAAASGEH